MKYFCEYCGYIANESEFLEGECPACCRDLFTGEVNKTSIPKVFHEEKRDAYEQNCNIPDFDT